MEELRILKNEGNEIIVAFSGKINTDNAKETENELLRILEENPGKQPVFDFEKLGYISSAGLRVLLKAAKTKLTKEVAKILK